jgi:spermidine/putrescine transport system substrate-binding protein
MKRVELIVVLGLAASLLGCAARKPELHVYTWADYMKPELVERFQNEFKCKVVVDTFDSNESMYAKLKAGATGYDVIFPSSYMVRLMWQQGMLQKFNPALLPNRANVDPEYLKIAMDPGLEHSLPYMITYTGIAYLGSRVTNAEPSFAMFDRRDLAGRMTMLNDMRETLGAALKFLGLSLNTTNAAELAQAKDVVIRWKKNLAKFENEQYKTGLASGEFLLVHGYSGDILQVRQENKDIRFMLPREGFSISCDDMVIPVTAKQPALAHAFINFLHDPKVAAENTEFVQYLCPNSASYPLLSEEIRNDRTLFPTPEVRAKGEVIKDLGPQNPMYVKVWDEIKAAE